MLFPAHAGVILPHRWPSSPVRKDHPRMGGEKHPSRCPPLRPVGSPPHGRGKAQRLLSHSDPLGITPAWAGKSCTSSSRNLQIWDHPRMGGEKPADSCDCDVHTGSPPHGRGKAFLAECRYSFVGITPAWAGKRLKRSHRSGIFISGPIPFHSVLHRPAGSGGSRAGRDGSPAGQPQNAGPA